MPLPIKPLPIVERWDCHQGGICCRGSRGTQSAEDLTAENNNQTRTRPEPDAEP